jgi:DNA-binding MarR family transcriptional regulator
MDMSEVDSATRIPAACTCSRVRKAARRVSQIYDQALEPYGFTISQYGILVNLRQLDGASIGQLAERMVMDPTSLTRALKPLERQGFLSLDTDPNDRRARRLSLTPEGLAAMRAAKPGWVKAQTAVEQALGAEETLALHASLDRTLDRLAPR